MSSIDLMRESDECSWPPWLQRRGGIAAAVLLVLLLDARPDRWIAGLVPWLDSALGYELGEAWLPLLVLPLLGPGALRGALGGRPTAAAMCIGFLCGLLDVALSWGYGHLLDQFAPLRWLEVGTPERPMFAYELAVTLIGPLVEEWAIRGVLWHSVRRACRPWVTVVVTALVFMVLHGPSRIRAFPCIFVFGVLLGVLRHRSRSLSPTILAHSVTNLSFVVLVSH